MLAERYPSFVWEERQRLLCVAPQFYERRREFGNGITSVAAAKPPVQTSFVVNFLYYLSIVQSQTNHFVI
jgi:hypothetical protein